MPSSTSSSSPFHCANKDLEKFDGRKQERRRNRRMRRRRRKRGTAAVKEEKQKTGKK